jgi:hypothetical protein
MKHTITLVALLILIGTTTAEILFLNESGIGNEADASTYSAAATTKYGDASPIFLTRWSSGKGRIWIRWNLSQIPIGATIDNASLGIYQYSEAFTAGQSEAVTPKYMSNLSVNPPMETNGARPWNESNITYNSQMTSVAGQTYIAAGPALTYADGEVNLWRIFNVTLAVSAVVQANNKSVDFLITTAEGSAATNQCNHYSKEYTLDTSVIPYLLIGYTPTTTTTTTTDTTTTTTTDTTTTTTLTGISGILNLTGVDNEADTSVYSASANTNYGTNTALFLTRGTSYKGRIYIRFNLTSVPAGVYFTNATLKLYQYSEAFTTGQSETVTAYYFNNLSVNPPMEINGARPWNETNVTYNSQPTTVAGQTVQSLSSLLYSDGEINLWRNFNVIAAIGNVTAASNKTVTFMLRTGEAASASNQLNHYSKEYTTSSLTPVLEIGYNSATTTTLAYPHVIINSPANQTKLALGAAHEFNATLYNSSTTKFDCLQLYANLSSSWQAVNITCTPAYSLTGALNALAYNFPVDGSYLWTFRGNLTNSTEVWSETGNQTVNIRKNFIIVRMDDVKAFGEELQMENITNTLLDNNIHLTVGLIPQIHDSFINFTQDATLMAYLNSRKSNGEYEIALHGFNHTAREFLTLGYTEAKNRMTNGAAMIQDGLGVTVKTFIPPQNLFNTNALNAANDIGLKRFSAKSSSDVNRYVEYPSGLLHVPENVEFNDIDMGRFRTYDEMVSGCNSALDAYGVCVFLFHPYEFYHEPTGTMESSRFQVLASLVPWIKQKESEGVILSTIYQYPDNPELPPFVSLCQANQSSMSNGTIFYVNSTVSNQTYVLNSFWVGFNNTIFTPETAVNGSNTFLVDSTSLIGNYSLNCYFNDTMGLTGFLEGDNINIINTDTTTTSTSTTSTTTTDTTTSTTDTTTTTEAGATTTTLFDKGGMCGVLVSLGDIYMIVGILFPMSLLVGGYLKVTGEKDDGSTEVILLIIGSIVAVCIGLIIMSIISGLLCTYG